MTEKEMFEKTIVEKCGFNPKTSFELSSVTGDYKSDVVYFAWLMWQASANREGYKLVKQIKTIGNKNVDWNQAPVWAKYWLKDNHSNKYWWSSSQPTIDKDLACFVWSSNYQAEEAPDFGYDGLWSKSMTSRKAMIGATP